MTIRLLLCLALLSLAGCPTTKTRDTATEEPVPTEKNATVGSAVPDELMSEIRADLVARTGSDRGITITRAEAVVYNDGSLGCPEPGRMYTQALVNGYWVVLEQDGRRFDYRASGRGYFRLCKKGQPPRLHESTH